MSWLQKKKKKKKKLLNISTRDQKMQFPEHPLALCDNIPQ